MKELQESIKDKVESAEQREIKKALILFGHLKPQRGQKVYELDITTHQIKEAAIEITATFRKGADNRKLVVKNDCWYAVAINRENACRKFLKMLNNLK